jgi:hypothetical protein
MLLHQGLQIALLYSSTTKTPPFNEFIKSDHRTNTSCIRVQGRLNFIKRKLFGNSKQLLTAGKSIYFDTGSADKHVQS